MTSEDSKNRPRVSSSLFARRATFSARHRMSQEMLESRLRSFLTFRANTFSSARRVVAGPSLGLRRSGNKFHHRRATSPSDQWSTTSGRFRRMR